MLMRLMIKLMITGGRGGGGGEEEEKEDNKGEADVDNKYSEDAACFF